MSEDVPAFAQLVSASLLRDEPGLLPTTKYVLTLQTSVPVKEPKDAELISPDRIMLAGRAYQVDVVDRIKYPNLLHVQLSEDMR
ncbi:hypothetical protein [Paenibacillus cellulosilyticus]|uniref:hypothetical protein n=1 Tax=Paenibacillus cellulosilyticus TaxID=375489 RepID=UPI001FED4876|nr:hypothetical protein [Paenibacillus cellulosilyticus]